MWTRGYIMSSLTLANPKELIVGHLQVLRLYASQVMLQGGSLTSDEEDDKAERMRELAGICSSFGLTGKETVGLVFRNLFVTKRGCGCPSCRERGNRGAEEKPLT